jgi:HEAT repeat protein
MKRIIIASFLLVSGLALIFYFHHRMGNSIDPNKKEKLSEKSSIDYWRLQLKEDFENNTESLYPSSSFPLRKEPDPSLIPVLNELLKDQDFRVRWSALGCLFALGSQAKSAVPNIIELLEDPYPIIRQHAAEFLGKHGKSGGKIGPKLKKNLCDPDFQVSLAASKALFQIKENDSETLMALKRILNNNQTQNIYNRIEAAQTIGNIGSAAKEAVPSLISVISVFNKDDSLYGSLQSICAESLGKIGPDAMEALPFLQKAMKSPIPSVRAHSAGAFWLISGKTSESFPILHQVLIDDNNPDYDQKIACQYLGRMGRGAKDAIPTLCRVAKKSQSDELRKIARESLIAIEGGK